MQRRAFIETASLAQIHQAARAALPCEACGLLVGRHNDREWRIERAVATRNLAAPQHQDRFEIDFRDHFQLQRELRHTGSAIIGLYHSHPNGRATPSTTDLDMAMEPGLLWLITGLGGQHAARAQPPATKAYVFRAAPRRFEDVTLVTDDERDNWKQKRAQHEFPQ